jgi:hypothetical protein
MIGTSIKPSVITLPAGTSTLLVPSSGRRQFLALQNIGANPATLTFAPSGTPVAVAGQGWQLAANGDGFSWDGLTVPTDAIAAVSASGTTIVVLEG